MLGVVAAIALAAGVGIGVAAGGKTKTRDVAGPTLTVTETATETLTESPPAPTFATPNNLPAPADFKITVKIKQKQCFGSAGCDLVFQIDPHYIGTQDISSLSLSITYEVSGVQDGPQINTFTIVNGTASFDSSETAQTTSTTFHLTAKATDVSAQ